MDLNQNFSGFLNTNSSGISSVPATPSAAPNGLTQDFSSVTAPAQQPQTLSPLDSAKINDVLASEGATALKPIVSAFYGQESSNGSNPQTSVNGAMGGMQIMPATFTQYARPGENINNPVDNFAVGARMLKDYAQRYNGDPARIAVAYFSGPGNVSTNGPTPWKQNVADGNGTTVSQYVQGILSRVGAAAPQPQQPSAPTAPDLSQAPKWTAVVQNPAFQKLSPEQQQQTADAYFQKWIAPNVPPDQLAAMQTEWGQRSAEVMKAAQPSLLSRLGSGIQSAASSLVNGGFATDGMTPDNPAAQNAAVAQSAAQPNTAGVLGTNNTPQAVAAAQKNLPPLPAMASPAMQQQVFQQYDAATPVQRQQMMEQPGLVGQLAQYRAAQYANNTNPESYVLGTSVEDRAARLMSAGVAPDIARAQAQQDANAGVPTVAPAGEAKPTDFDFDTAEKYAPGNGFFGSPLVRGAVSGEAGQAQMFVGMGRFLNDMTGGNPTVSGWLDNASKNVSNTTNAIGTAPNLLTRNLEAATSGVVQVLPAMLGAAVTDGASALPIVQFGLQTFGQQYDEGRSAGQDPAQASLRSGMMAAFAMLGHAAGIGPQIEALQKSIAGAATNDIAGSIWSAAMRDLPSTQAMALGNFVTDKLPGGVGLAPQAKFTDWLHQAGDMFVQTAMMNGMLGGTSIGGAPLARTLRGEVVPTFDESSGVISDKNGNYWNTAPGNPGPALGAPGTSANAPHPSQVTADNIVREMAAEHGLDASGVIPEPTPVPQPAPAPIGNAMGDGRVEPGMPATAAGQPSLQPGTPVVWRNADTDVPVVYRGVAPDRGADGRLYAQVEHNGAMSFVPFDELAPAAAAQPPSVSPSNTSGAAPTPAFDPQQVLEFAQQRRDALLAKQQGTLGTVMTPGGYEDVDPQAQALTPSERAELDVLTQHANNPAAIAKFYGLDGTDVEPGEPTAAQVDTAAHEAATSPQNDIPEPTQAQKEAGNYQKGHVEIHGLDVTIENPQGSTRSGTSPDGVVWQNTLQDHYGYIRRTVGADEEQIDAFVGPNPESRKVFIVDQRAPETGNFDEHKVMLGYDSMAEADAAYHRNYEPGWDGRAAISELPIGSFKEWLEQGDTRAPFARAVTPATRSAGERPRTEKEARAQRAASQQPTGFTTAKGSTYVVHEDGTTTRNKAARTDVGHEGDSGPKDRSARTVYVDEGAARLSAAGLSLLNPERGARVAIKDGKATLVTWNDEGGRWGASRSSRDIPIYDTPVVGRYPLELWKPVDDVPGYEAYRGMHAGNQITELTAGKAAPPKTEREAQARKLEKADGSSTEAQNRESSGEAQEGTAAGPLERTARTGTRGTDGTAGRAGADGGTVAGSASDAAGAGRGVRPESDGSGRGTDAGDVKPRTEREARAARVARLVGKVGDVVRASNDFDYVKGGEPMRIERVEKSGAVRFVRPDDPDTGTTVTPGAMDRALRSVKFEKVEPDAPKTAPPESESARAVYHSLARPDDDGARFAAEYLTELAAHDDLFQHPVSKSHDMVGVMRDVVPEATYVGDVTAADERSESGADQKLLFRTVKGHDFYVYETPKKVWLDVSRLDTGENGSGIYSAVANYAHNTKRVFIGDPAGLSDVALRRRTDNMLSSALKFGTTDHLEPHPDQLAGNEKLGVPPMSWRAGDDLHNIRSMIDVSLKSFYHDYPEARNVRYDFDRRAFRIGEGKPVADEALDQWRLSQGGDRAASPGHATLKRNALLDSLSRSESGERPRLLEQALSQSRQRVLEPDLRGTFYDANGEHPRLDASAFARDGFARISEPDRTSALTTLRRLNGRLEKGEITDSEFRLGAQNLLSKLEAKRDGQLERQLDKGDRERGDLYIRERLLRAVRHGDLSHEGMQFAQWLIDKNPAIADDLGISVRSAPRDSRGTAGTYNAINRVVTLFKGNTNVGTAVHEILHHTERMMPDDIRHAIYRAWSNDWKRAYQDATAKQKAAFAEMLKAALGDQRAWGKVADAFHDGTLDYDQHYKLVNPSEYWAVKATDLLKSRFDAGSWIARAKQWLREMFERVKSILGLSSDAPVLRGLDSVLKGDGEFKVDTMMGERAPRDPARDIERTDDQATLQNMYHDLAKSPTERADESYERARTIIDKSFDTKSTAKTFNWLEKTFASQVHKAIKDPDYARVFNAMRRMMNHTGLASTRAAEYAPMIVPHSDNLRQSVKTLFAGKRQSQDIKGATRALLDGTLAGDSVLKGRTWSDKELRESYKLSAKGIEAYKQTRAAIDASLDEVAAAEAWSMVHGFAPLEIRDQIVNNPGKAPSLIRGSLDAKIEMLQRAHDRAAEKGDMQKAEILQSLMMPYVETRKKVDDIFDKSEMLKTAGYVPLMRFGKYTVYANKIDPETGLSARDDETGAPLVHYFGMFQTEAEAQHEHEKQLALYRDDPTVQISRGVKSEKGHLLYDGLSPETLSLFADKVGADEAMKQVIQLALSERSALKRRLDRRAISGYSEDLPRILSNFLTSNGRFAAQRLFMRDVNKAIQDIPKEKGDVTDEAVKLKQFVLNGDDPGSRTMAGMFLWTMAGSPVSAAVIASEPFQKIFPYLAQFGVGRATAGIGKALSYVVGRRQITDPQLRSAMQRAAREGIIKPQEIFHLYDLGMQNMSTWLSSQLAAHSGPGAAITKGVADGIRARATALTTMLGMMHSAAETFGRKMAFHAAWEVAKARGEQDPYAWTVRAIDEAGSQFGKINRSNIERTYAGRMMLAYKQFTIGWLGLLFRMARKGGVEGARGAAVMLATQMAMGGLIGLPFMQNLDDLVDTIGNFMGHNTDFARMRRQWAEKAFGKAFGDTLMHGLARHLPVDLSEHFGMGDIIPGTDLLKAENAKDKARNVLNVLGPETQFITRLMDAYDAAAAGNYGKAALAVAPNFIKRPAQGLAMLASGKSVDTQGRKVADTDTFDALAKMAGGATAHTNEQGEIRGEVSQAVATTQDKQAQIVNMWARGIADGDTDAVNKARDLLAQWNANNPESRIVITAPALAAQVKQLRLDANTRAILSAPKGLKADAVSTLRGGGDE